MGERIVYAIGDLHGRYDLLVAMLRAIHADTRDQPSHIKPIIVLLGDYIDRGPQSRLVLDALLNLQRLREARVECLKGNHEAALLRFLADPIRGAAWLKWGGVETLRSYGVPVPAAVAAGRDLAVAAADLADALASVMPADHFCLLQSLRPTLVLRDYLFVHAVVKPGVPLELQSETDLLWIREEFLKAQAPFDLKVVHGHTPEDQPYQDERRIGLDTGAYESGVLTAARLEREEVRFMQVGRVAKHSAPKASTHAAEPAPRRSLRTSG